MKKVLNVIFLTFIFVASFVLFFPKEKLYYYAQEKLLAYSIMIDSKEVNSQAFSLDVDKTYILLSGSRVASIGHFNISLFGMSFENVNSLGTFKKMIPSAKQINISYKLGDFAKVEGDFGELIASFNLSDKKITFKTNAKQAVVNKYRMIFSKFKKVGDKYVYEINL